MHAQTPFRDLGIISTTTLSFVFQKAEILQKLKYGYPLIKKMGNTLSEWYQTRFVLGRNAVLVSERPHHKKRALIICSDRKYYQKRVLVMHLAVSLLQLRGFYPAFFARFHPGGFWDKRLYTRVSDIMTGYFV
jgi:arabinose-5-phosphate isomerase